MANPKKNYDDELAAMQVSIAAQGQLINAQGELIAEQGATIAEQGATIAALQARVDTLGEEVVALERDNPKGITASAPVPMTEQEVAVLIRERPGTKVRVLADYRPLNLKTGDVFEPRHRVSDPVAFRSHITAGLRLVAA